MNPEEIVLCSPVRTAIGAYGGILKDTPAPMLGAAALRDVICALVTGRALRWQSNGSEWSAARGLSGGANLL